MPDFPTQKNHLFGYDKLHIQVCQWFRECSLGYLAERLWCRDQPGWLRLYIGAPPWLQFHRTKTH